MAPTHNIRETTKSCLWGGNIPELADPNFASKAFCARLKNLENPNPDCVAIPRGLVCEGWPAKLPWYRRSRPPSSELERVFQSQN